MKIEFNLDDVELKKHVKDLVRKAIVEISSQEINKIAREEVKKKFEKAIKDNEEFIRETIRMYVMKCLEIGYGKDNYVKEYTREKVTEIISENFKVK